MRRFISILLAVMLMASMVVSASAVGNFNIVATGDGDEATEVVYVVAGNAEGESGKPDSLFNAFWDPSYEGNTMTKNDDGTFSKTFTAEKAYENVGLKVVKKVNGESTWLGDANGDNVQFAVTAAGDFTVTIDPETNKITVTGDSVKFASSFEYKGVYAVGQSVTTGFLNDINWDPGAESNLMTETSKDVWEISYDVSPDNGMQVKFAIDGTWDRNFGIAKTDAPEVKNGEAFAAAWDGANIALPMTDEYSDGTISLKLDLTNFDFTTKTGALVTITWTCEAPEPETEAPTGEPATGEPATDEPATDEPAQDEGAYYIIGDMTDWTTLDAYKLTKNEEAEGDEYVFEGLDLTTESQFKVVYEKGNQRIWYPDGMGNNYGENGEITVDGTYDIYFRPNGDGGDDWFYSVIYVALCDHESTEEPATDAPTDEPTPETEAPTAAPAPETEAPTDEPATSEPEQPIVGASTFYVVGSFNEWQTDDAYILTANPEAENEYMLAGVELKADDEFKVVETNGSIQGFEPVWYPSGFDNNYVVAADGTYDIYFRPNYDGGDDWFYGCIYAAAQEEPAPETDAPTDAPAPETEAPTDAPEPTLAPQAGQFYVVGNFTGWAVNEAYKMTLNQQAETEEYMYNVDLTTESQFKVVYVDPETSEQTWFPDGMGNNYGENGEITADGNYDIYFRPNCDGGDDWFYGCIYAAAQEEPATETEAPTDEPATEAPTDAPATEAPTDAPETDAPAPEPKAYVVGNFTDWAVDDAYQMAPNDQIEEIEYCLNLDLTTSDQFKCVIVMEGEQFWFPDGMGNNFGENGEITADGNYNIYFRPEYDGGDDWFYNCIYVESTEEPATEASTGEPETDAPIAGAPTYYVVGSFTGWKIDEAYALTKNDAADTEEYVLTGVALRADDEFKVESFTAGIEGGNPEWYPVGDADNYVVAADGTYDIYFRPNYDGGDDWFYGCIYVDGMPEPATEPATDAPTGEPSTEPVGDATYVVAGNAEGTDSAHPDDLFGAFWDPSYEGNTMTKNDDGTFSKTFNAEKAYDSVGLKVVKKVGDTSTWIGDANGNNVQFAVTAPGAFTVTIDPATNEITVTGDNVQFATDFEYTAVYAVGSSVKTGFLNDIDWDPGAGSNLMTETSKDVWEIAYDVSPDNGMQVKFAIDGTWDRNFGIAKTDAPEVKNGEAFAAAWDGANIALPITDKYSDGTISLKLDLTNFDFTTKTGALVTITWTCEAPEPETEAPTGEPATGEPATGEPGTEPIEGAPTYYVAGSFTDWQIDDSYTLSANPAAEGEFMLTGIELKAADELKVTSFNGSILGGDQKWYPDGMDNNYVVAEDGTYDIYFRPDGQGGEDWYAGYFYLALQGEPSTEPATGEPSTEPATGEPSTEPATGEPGTEPFDGAPNYYVAGSFTDWQIDDSYTLSANPAAEGEFMLTGIELKAADELKVTSYNGSILGGDQKWYPDGMDNNYVVAADGTYDIYFRPDGQGGEDWYAGYIYLDNKTPTPTEPPTEPPTEKPLQGKSFYIVGDITDPIDGRRLSWDTYDQLDGNMLLETVEEGTLYKYENIAIYTDDSFKVIKSSKKGDAVASWYPDGMDNNRTVAEDGIYTIWFRPNGDGTAEDGWDYIYTVSDGSGDELNHGCTTGGYMYKLEKTGEAPEKPTEPVQALLPGDIDGDGVVTIYDVTYIQKHLAGFDGYKELTELQQILGDVDGDGEVTLMDATHIQRYLVDIIDDGCNFDPIYPKG